MVTSVYILFIENSPNNFTLSLTNQGYTVTSSEQKIEPEIGVYTDHSDFINITQTLDIQLIRYYGCYFYAHDPETNITYITTTHWRNYVQWQIKYGFIHSFTHHLIPITNPHHLFIADQNYLLKTLQKTLSVRSVKKTL